MKTNFSFNSVVVAIIAIVLGMVFVACSGNELEVEPKGENGGNNNGHGTGHLDANVDTVYVVSSEIVENSRKVVDTDYGKKVSYNRKNIVRVQYNDLEDNFHFDTTVMSTNILNVYIPAKRDVYRKDLVFETEGAVETRGEENGVKTVNNLFSFDGTKENIRLTSETQSFSFAGKQVIFPEITWGQTEFMANENTFVKDSVIGDRTFHYHTVALTFMSDLSDYTSEQYDALLGVFTTDDGYVPGGDDDDPNIIFNGYEHLRDTLKNETNLFAKFTKIQIWNDGRNERKEIEIDLLSAISGQAEEIHEQTDSIIRFGETRTTTTPEQYQNGFVTGDLVTTTHTTYFGSWKNVVTTKILSNAVYDDGDIKVNLGEKTIVVSYATATQTAHSYEVMNNGKKYNRYPYTLQYLASVSVLKNHKVNNSVLIDVEKAEPVDEIIKSYGENREIVPENGKIYSQFTKVVERSISGIKRTVVRYEITPEYGKISLPAVKQNSNKVSDPVRSASDKDGQKRTDGNFTVQKTTRTVNENFVSFTDTHTATYVSSLVYEDKELKSFEMLTAEADIVFVNSQQSNPVEHSEGANTYNRYPTTLNYERMFNGEKYEDATQSLFIDVLKPFEKNTPDEWGGIDWDNLDKAYASKSFEADRQTSHICVAIPFKNGIRLFYDNNFPKENGKFTNEYFYTYGIDIEKSMVNAPISSVTVLTSVHSSGCLPGKIVPNDGSDIRLGWGYNSFTNPVRTQSVGKQNVAMMKDKTPYVTGYSFKNNGDGSLSVILNGTELVRIK